ncbi:hypothetical protein LX83_000451 [Goodfellowiella coeruleoviolacea]|uniref:Uncharacterized protein n=1 Tax=Goodfellowiella coeruleoviolacea TaxID=334858 RepID=A0AAE3KD42_9PSEU|nr:hypothetical protein [Goodfellowiella coeruleoviolacea]
MAGEWRSGESCFLADNLRMDRIAIEVVRIVGTPSRFRAGVGGPGDSR